MKFITYLEGKALKPSIKLLNPKQALQTIALVLLTLLPLGQGIAQTDDNGNPVFNSISTSEKTVKGCLLISNYYTLKNNIESRKSSVFVAEKPNLDQIEKAALNLTSEFFILTRESKMLAMIILANDPKREFVAITIASGEHSTFPCRLKGDITENRANEIIKQNYDPKAMIVKGKLRFNQKEFKIISNHDIETAVLDLIENKKIDQVTPSDVTLPSRKELKEYILSETAVGGEFDFFTIIKGKENDGAQIKPGVFTTNRSIALYKWGRSCFKLGVNTVEDAYEIFAEFSQKEVSNRDKEYIKMGFFKEWE